MRAYPAARRPTSPRSTSAGHPGVASRALTTTRNPARFWLISDDRSACAPARIHRAGRPRPPTATIHITGVFTLLTEPASHFHRPVNALTQTPRCPTQKPSAGTRAASARGGRARRLGTRRYPRLREAMPTGQWARYSPPPAFTPPHVAAAPAHRAAPQRASLEGLAFSDDGCTAWLAMEMAWDGARPTVQTAGGPVRITALTWPRARHSSSGLTPDAVPARADCPILGSQRRERNSGRWFAPPAGAGTRLQRGRRLWRPPVPRRPAQRQRHTGRTGTAARQPHPAAKTLLLDFATLGLATVDNLEGMTFTARCPAANGRWCWCLTTTSRRAKHAVAGPGLSAR